MIKKSIWLLLLLVSLSEYCKAQISEDTLLYDTTQLMGCRFPPKNPRGGMLGLGLRTTFSTFNDGNWGNTGMGVGGHFRLWFSRKINSEWFFDYIEQHYSNRILRRDYHIGWSVMYYIGKSTDLHKIRPYVLAGHCFDYTRITDQRDSDNFGKRWSGAVQAGMGAHFNVTPSLDLSLTAQYMIHLGSDLHAHIVGDDVKIENHKGINPEGHILITTSVNYKIAYLWKRK